MDKIKNFYEKKLGRKINNKEKIQIEKQLNKDMSTNAEDIINFLKNQKEFAIKELYRNIFGKNISESNLKSLYIFFNAKDNINNKMFARILFNYMKKNNLSELQSVDLLSNSGEFKYFNNMTNIIIEKIAENIYEKRLVKNNKYLFDNLKKNIIYSVQNNFPHISIYKHLENYENINIFYLEKQMVHLKYCVILYYIFSNYINYKLPNDIKKFGTNFILNENLTYDKIFIQNLFIRKIIGSNLPNELLSKDMLIEKIKNKKYNIKLDVIDIIINMTTNNINNNMSNISTKFKKLANNNFRQYYEINVYNNDLQNKNILKYFDTLLEKDKKYKNFFNNKIVVVRSSNIIDISKYIFKDIEYGKIYTTKYNLINSLLDYNPKYSQLNYFIFNKEYTKIKKNIINNNYISIINDC